MRIEQLTPAIGAEISGVNLGDAARDADLFAEVKAALLKHRVIFLRDQEITRAEHVAFARRFGDLEVHPVAGSDPEHPGLVQIYRNDKRENYENNYHSDGLWRQTPAMGCVLRCIECPPHSRMSALATRRGYPQTRRQSVARWWGPIRRWSGSR